MSEKNISSLTQRFNDGANGKEENVEFFSVEFSLKVFLQLFLAKPQGCELLERVMGHCSPST